MPTRLPAMVGIWHRRQRTGTQTTAAGVVLPPHPLPRSHSGGRSRGSHGAGGGLPSCRFQDANQPGGAYGSTPLGWAAFAGDLPMLPRLWRGRPQPKGRDAAPHGGMERRQRQHCRCCSAREPTHKRRISMARARLRSRAGSTTSRRSQGANQVFALQEWRVHWWKRLKARAVHALLEAAAERSVQPSSAICQLASVYARRQRRSERH